MRGPASFSSFDTNNDGVITKKEFKYAHQKRMQERSEAGMPMRNAGNAPKFRFFDENGDGVITRAEYRHVHRERMQKRIQQRDDYGMGTGSGMGKGQMRKCTGTGQGPNR
jgi:Ca2+-binding EF-hand superfamily protein